MAHSSPNYTKLSLILSSIFILIAILIWQWFYHTDRQHFPVKQVKVEGQYTHADPAYFQQMILPYTEAGWVHLSASQLQQHLQQLSWLDSVNVYRIWPDTVMVRFTEKNALLRFGKDALLTEQGDLFYPHKKIVSNHYPELTGPKDRYLDMLEHYQKAQKMLTPVGLHIKKIELSARLAWHLYLDNGIVLLLGSSDVLTRLDRFVKVYNRVFSHQYKRVNYVDLRYPSGFAVNWKQEH